jgi:hypothetical protein
VPDRPPLVAIGRRLEELPQSKAPLVLGLGFVLVMVSMLLRGCALPGSGAVSLVGLLLVLSGVVMAWWRLTTAGRILLAAPQVLWLLALAFHGMGDDATGQVLMLIGLAIFVVGFLLVVEPVGPWSGGLHMQRGRINRNFVRSYDVTGPAECRVEDDGVRILTSPGGSESYPTSELAPPRLEVQPTHSDLVILDVYGDAVLRIRGTSDEEQRSLARVAEELRARVNKPPP